METALSSKVLKEDEMESGPLAEIDETTGQGGRGALFDVSTNKKRTSAKVGGFFAQT